MPGGNNNPTAGDFNLEWKQGAARAGSTRAFTCIRFVTGAVRPAGQKSAIVVEEFIRPPIERCSGMGAIVDISIVVPAEVYDEAFDKPLAPANMKFRGVARRDFVTRRRPHCRLSC